MAEKRLQENTTGGWVAMLQHYFVGALIPPEKVPAQAYTDVQDTNHYVLGYKNLTPTQINPSEGGRLHTRLYLGPKEQDRLEQIAPGLSLTVDYGWLTVIAAPLYWVLSRIHQAVGNWGWSIVILTVLIKLAFYPLSAASYKSMANMRRLQPRLVSLKERFGDDRQRMHQAQMELYKTEKLNPLGGCLPILVQVPVFIALYWVLLESVELRQAPFILWIKDLSSPDPYFVLPIIMGITMAVTQMLSPASLDPIQKKVMMALPFVFTVFFLFFPSGLVLYWVVNNVLSIAQQWWITRTIERQAKPSKVD
jgi:YidC/Oxa1 family membrane protein insertase